MENIVDKFVPFLTRKMLAFEHAAVLSLRIRSQLPGTITLQIRGYTKEGQFAFKHTTNSDSTPKTETFRIPDVPIMVNVIDISDNVNQGGGYITLDLLINDDRVHQLCSGFVYGGKSISFPNATTLDSAPGYGAINFASQSSPAAGANMAISVPAFEIWKIHIVTFRLVTDANVANRRVHLRFIPTLGAIIEALTEVDQPASLTRNYTFAKYGYLPSTNNNTEIIAPLPHELFVTPEGTINTAILNIQAGDQISNIKIMYERFYSPI